VLWFLGADGQQVHPPRALRRLRDRLGSCSEQSPAGRGCGWTSYMPLPGDVS
jgi:hypothetical protein